MTRLFATNEPKEPTGAYVVRRPRTTDALGSSLRRVFGEDTRLPADIRAALGRLDAIR